MKRKPGVMVYFELRGMLKLLSDAEKGQLFEAILDYGETGETGELTDTLKIVWPLIQDRLDKDSFQYDKKVVKKKYASYTRWSKEHSETPLPYEDWLDSQGYDVETYTTSAS